MKAIAIFVATLLFSGAASASERLQQFPAVINRLKAIELFSLDPMPAREGETTSARQFHKWAIRKSAMPATVASGDALARSMDKITKSHVEWASACFDPHHGVTFSDGTAIFDVVMCFRCSRYMVYAQDGTVVWGGSFHAEGEGAKWETIFGAAGLPKALGE
jgi:hypothetical protein